MIETIKGFVGNDGWKILIENSGTMPIVILVLFFLAVVISVAVVGINQRDKS